jgi:hypothetical protein
VSHARGQLANELLTARLLVQVEGDPQASHDMINVLPSNLESNTASGAGVWRQGSLKEQSYHNTSLNPGVGLFDSGLSARLRASPESLDSESKTLPGMLITKASPTVLGQLLSKDILAFLGYCFFDIFS